MYNEATDPIVYTCIRLQVDKAAYFQMTRLMTKYTTKTIITRINIIPEKHILKFYKISLPLTRLILYGHFFKNKFWSLKFVVYEICQYRTMKYHLSTRNIYKRYILPFGIFPYGNKLPGIWNLGVTCREFPTLYFALPYLYIITVNWLITNTDTYISRISETGTCLKYGDSVYDVIMGLFDYIFRIYFKINKIVW